MENKKLKILLCGAFGYGNLGDDILRDTLIDLLYNRYNNIEIYTDRPYPCQELIDLCDLRIIGPGGLLYDENKTHIEYFKKYLKKPFCLVGVGIQFPNIVKKNGLIYNSVKNTELIIGRNSNDVSIFNSINNVPLDIMPDLAFFSSYFKKTNYSYIKKDPHIIFCPNGINIDNNIINLFLRQNTKNAISSLLSFHVRDDKKIDKLRKLLNVERTTIDFYHTTPYKTYNIISHADLLITGRFHAAIMAIHSKVKVVNLFSSQQSPYKLKSLQLKNINFEELLNDTKKYIDSIKLIDSVCNKNIDDIISKNFDPLRLLDLYLKNTFKIENKL